VKKKVARLIYTSTASLVFDNDDILDAQESLPYLKNYPDIYSETKCLGEKAIIDANGSDNGTKQGLLTCSLRPHSIIGPGDRIYWPSILEKSLEGKLKIIVGSGENLTSVTYIDNICHAQLLAAEALITKPNIVGKQIYNINDGEDAKFWEMAKYVAVEVGKCDPSKVGTIKIPYALMHWIGFINEIIDSNFGYLWNSKGPTFTRYSVALMAKHHTYSIEKAKRDLSYNPVVPLKEGWRRSAEDLTKRHKAGSLRFSKVNTSGKWLSYWLIFVALISINMSITSFFTTDVLKNLQFVRVPDQITPITGRFYGAWTILAALIRFIAGFDIHNKQLFTLAYLSFWVALLVYTNELVAQHTIPLFNALPPLATAAISVIWMTFLKPKVKRD